MRRQRLVIQPGVGEKKTPRQLKFLGRDFMESRGCSMVLTCASASSAKTAGTWCAGHQAPKVPGVQSQFPFVPYFM